MQEVQQPTNTTVKELPENTGVKYKYKAFRLKIVRQPQEGFQQAEKGL